MIFLLLIGPDNNFRKILYLLVITSSLIVTIANETEDHSAELEHQLDCSLSKHECCPDGVASAKGPGFKDCKEDTSLFLIDKYSGNDASICALPEPTRSCDNYTIQWRFDISEGRCVQFWYGGCDGNANRFNTFEECEARCVSPNGTDKCKLPLVNSDKQCELNETRYYYDGTSFSCKKFIYSGCFGNNNNFHTMEECERRCQVPLLFEQCLFIPDQGPCLGKYERWYFDSKVGMCRTFNYGGCLKNKNNHLNEKDCIDSCVKPKQKAVCVMPKIMGNCEEKINSWYYDVNAGSCKPFIYSGCNGNLNRFESLEACEYTCQGLKSVDKVNLIQQEMCDAPKIAGYCHLKLQRWYYNKTTQMCHQFTYTGCDVNSNNFESEHDCRSMCNAKETNPCVLPVDHGTCDNYKIFWYFNQVDRECVRFYYGGCDGNQNRFDQKETCEFSCKLTIEEKQVLMKLPKQCIMPLETGSNCEEENTKYYFDMQTKVCFPFEYSGCGPETSNRFETDEECNKLCNENYVNENITINSSSIDMIMQIDKVDVNICELEMKQGNCSQKVIKWFYDKTAKYCKQFDFTGCNGNENRFETRQQCTEICENPKRREICNSNKIQGPCLEFQKRWYFDTETKSCNVFKYGGCFGNENNFGSKIECRNFCWDYLSDEARATNESTESILPTTSDSNETKEFCLSHKDEGNLCPARNNITQKWYYDPNISACQKFTYLGCAGNQNRFDTLFQCDAACSSTQAFILDTSNFRNDNECESPANISDECLNDQTSEILPSKLLSQDSIWYYEIEARACKKIEKSCIPAANSNRFLTRDACQKQCIPNVVQTDTQGNHECPSIADCTETCQYGREKSLSGCELCECHNPCQEFNCSPDHGCAVENSKAVCRLRYKPGMCPHVANMEHESCNITCTSDAECFADEKCCFNHCGGRHCVSASFDSDPIIEDFIDRIEVMEGDKLILPCKVTGYPMPTVTWFKNRHEFTFDKTNSRVIMNENNSLVIFNLTDKDEAIYSCRASNNKGKAAVKESTVFVNEPLLISFNPESPVFKLDSEGKITCIVDNPSRINQISWFKNGAKLQTNDKYSINSSVLTVLNVNVNDSGKYVCKVNAGQSTVTKAVLAKVIENEVEVNCEDTSSYTDCKLVVTRSLCTKWGQFCCRTCRLAGFEVNL